MTTKKTTTTKRSKITQIGVQTVSGSKVARNRAAIDQVAIEAKTAVYIGSDGKRHVIKRVI